MSMIERGTKGKRRDDYPDVKPDDINGKTDTIQVVHPKTGETIPADVEVNKNGEGVVVCVNYGNGEQGSGGRFTSGGDNNTT